MKKPVLLKTGNYVFMLTVYPNWKRKLIKKQKTPSILLKNIMKWKQNWTKLTTELQ